MSTPINSPEPDEPRPYVSLERFRERVTYEPEDFFHDSHNPERRFDRLAKRALSEATSIINNNTGDETWHRETDRTDIHPAPSGRILGLVYPVVEVSSVERLYLSGAGGGGQFREIPDRSYAATEHGVKLRSNRSRAARFSNPRVADPNGLTRNADSAEWSSMGTEVRVTYTRGYEEIPANIKQLTTNIANRMLRNLKNEQNVAAASPDELAGVSPEYDRVISDSIQESLDGLTTLGGATYTV